MWSNLAMLALGLGLFAFVVNTIGRPIDLDDLTLSDDDDDVFFF